MTIDVYSAAGQKTGSMELPEDLFGAEINWGLMHQAVLMQQGNRRHPVAHVKTRGEIVGSTKKLFAQKHTGRARRGPGRSPVLRGGGKTFGPRNDANFTRDMPRKMRHAALRSCLSLQAKEKRVMVLENYPDDVKTKAMATLLKKIKIETGRRTLVVIPGEHRGVQMSARNIDGVKAIRAAYLNPEDVLNARAILFLADAIKVAQDVFGKKEKEMKTPKGADAAAEKKPKKAPAKKTAGKKKSPASNT
jgi:large subunit ribosomal protein L4